MIEKDSKDSERFKRQSLTQSHLEELCQTKTWYEHTHKKIAVSTDS